MFAVFELSLGGFSQGNVSEGCKQLLLSPLKKEGALIGASLNPPSLKHPLFIARQILLLEVLLLIPQGASSAFSGGLRPSPSRYRRGSAIPSSSLGHLLASPRVLQALPGRKQHAPSGRTNARLWERMRCCSGMCVSPHSCGFVAVCSLA